MQTSALIIFSVHRSTVEGYSVGKRSKSFVETGAMYDELLLDTVERFRRITCATPLVFAATEEEAGRLSSEWPNLRVEMQSGDSQRERIRNAVEDAFEAGFRHVVIALSTIATIPHRIVECAFTLLDTLEDVAVMAPTVQGGYYLLGMRYPHEALLDAAGFDDPEAYENTLRHLPANEIALYLLHSWRDIRTMDDVQSLWTQIQYYPMTRDMLPRTSAYLDQHAAQLFPATHAD